jgi:separase
MKETKETLNLLTVVKLKERLSSIGVTSKEMRSLRKAGLIDLLFVKLRVAEEKEQSYQNMKKKKQNETVLETRESIHEKEKDCAFLILDEQLQSLPFEGMPMFQNQIICRLPSFPFALVSLLENNVGNSNPGKLPIIDPISVSYVLDPDANLTGTKDRLHPFLENISEHNKWDWDGVVGQIPSVNFMNDVLTRDRGLFLYCGHGGGERFFSRTEVESLVFNRVSSLAEDQHFSRSCQSCIVLMGCSSAKLSSVNASKHDHCREGHIHIEPEGIALNYLIGGAPCVIGNLWDVTDRDIDR